MPYPATASGPALAPDQRRRQHHGQSCLQGRNRGDRADPQDLGKQPGPRPHPGEMHDRPARSEIEGQDRGGQRRGRNDRDPGAFYSERRKRSEAEDQAWRERHEQHDPGADRERRHQHVAGAANDARQRIHQPDQRRAGEDDIRVGERGGKRACLAPERPVQFGSEPQHQRGEQGADSDVDDDGVQHQGVGVIPAAAAQGARHRRRDAAAHCAGRQHLHHHEPGKDQRDAGQGVQTEPRDPPGLDQPRRGGNQHDGDIRPSQPQQHRRDRGLEQTLGPGVEGKTAGGWRNRDRGYRLARRVPQGIPHGIQWHDRLRKRTPATSSVYAPIYQRIYACSSTA